MMKVSAMSKGKSMVFKRGYFLLFTGFFIGIVLASLLSSAYFSRGRIEGEGGMPSKVEITFLYSSEKQGWLEEVTPRFEVWFKERFGIDVSVKLVAAGSHETINLILHGFQPTIWSPASSIWIPYLNEKWKESHGGGEIAKEWVPLVFSPIVIAGWEDIVRRYNVSGFMDLYRLAKSGVPFKWGHPDPRLSNGGTMVVILEFAEAVGKRPEDLTLDDIKNETVLGIVRTIESHAVAYGKSTGFFGAWAADSGPSAITFFGVYENIVLENAVKARKKWGTRLIAIYPKFGTLLSDHPFVILNAEWVTPWQKFVASQYLYFLLQPEIQYIAQKHGFRPSNPSVPIDEGIFSLDNGVVRDLKVKVLRPPSGEVLDALLSLWEKVKNPGV